MGPTCLDSVEPDQNSSLNKVYTISHSLCIGGTGVDPGFWDRGSNLLCGVRFCQFTQFFSKFPMKMK